MTTKYLTEGFKKSVRISRAFGRLVKASQEGCTYVLRPGWCKYYIYAQGKEFTKRCWAHRPKKSLKNAYVVVSNKNFGEPERVYYFVGSEQKIVEKLNRAAKWYEALNNAYPV